MHIDGKAGGVIAGSFFSCSDGDVLALQLVHVLFLILSKGCSTSCDPAEHVYCHFGSAVSMQCSLQSSKCFIGRSAYERLYESAWRRPVMVFEAGEHLRKIISNKRDLLLKPA